MIVIEAYGITVIPIIIGLIEAAKIIGMPKRFSPVLALVLGIAAGVIYIDPGDIKGGILIGIAIGLSSIGLYSGTKNTIFRNERNGKGDD